LSTKTSNGKKEKNQSTTKLKKMFLDRHFAEEERGRESGG